MQKPLSPLPAVHPRGTPATMLAPFAFTGYADHKGRTAQARGKGGSDRIMTTQLLIGYIATAIIFGILDALWLGRMVPALYRPEIGEMLMRGWRPAPALVFYFLYILGIQIFAVAPALADGKWQTALVWGALFGFFCYMTYDLTNFATLKVWSLKVTIVDIIWGTVATGAAAGAAAWVTLAITNK